MRLNAGGGRTLHFCWSVAEGSGLFLAPIQEKPRKDGGVPMFLLQINLKKPVAVGTRGPDLRGSQELRANVMQGDN